MKNVTNVRVDYINLEKSKNTNNLTKNSQKQDIQKVLNDYGIKYEKDKVFDDFKYDYYIEELNLLIEFCDKNHYFEQYFFNNSKDVLMKQYELDKLKSYYAFENSINLIRIPFWSHDFDIKLNIDLLIYNTQMYLDKRDKLYLVEFLIKSNLDFNSVDIDDLYNNYEKMLKQLQVESKISYFIFKRYIIMLYELDFKEMLNKNGKNYEIYHRLENN